MTPSSASLPLRERVGQINQRLKGWETVRWIDGAPRVTDVLRREVDRWGGIGAIYGIQRADPWSQVRWSNGIPPERSAEAYQAVQDCVRTRGAGLPTLFVEEVPHGLMALGGTTLPVNLALGAGMDPHLTEELAAHVAAETRARGAHVALVSGLDMLRDPRWGRAEECFSEDPALAAALVEATVRGMQGSRPDGRIDGDRIAVVAKHLAGQGAGIGGRNGSGAPIGRREFGEIHLRPAFAAARACVAGFMAAYNDVDGIPCTANRDLLTGTLREDWGWQGIVMADGTAVDRLRDSAPDAASAAALAIHAGVDLSLWDEAFTRVEEAVDRGILDEADVTRAADRMLALKARLGLLDPSEATVDTPRSERPETREFLSLVSRAAAQACVLVHDEGALPLPSSAVVAVIGPNADDLDAQLGDYTPPRPDDEPAASTVRFALEVRHGVGNVRYAQGSGHRAALAPDATAEVSEALTGAGAAVVVLGGTSRRSYDDDFADNGAVDGPAPDTTNGEGVDLSALSFPQAQLDLLRAARAAVPRVIAVVIDGRPRPLEELTALCDSLIVSPFPGPAGGAAIVDVIASGIGGGLLPTTHPAGDGVFPVAHDERLETARGYVDARVPVGRLLGAGTPAGVTVTLRPSEPVIAVHALGDGETVTLHADVVNATSSDISLAVPLYGRRHELGIRPRRRTLLTVRRVQVGAGMTAAVPFELGLDELGSWARGRPEATRVEVLAWTASVHDPPAGGVTIRVTDEKGRSGWER
ncbi:MULTISPECIES: glycoside hydrolase family 3 protein [unclassified Microbacterium]|uniref:glycoside hydrolase family 3 protein n=1 Tax=unclassified Microbacterium TaxID=2609290 RepID=UPI000EA9CB30|nr:MULTISPECIES: glycoside hydrolase family 3 protein [unclassified Microbacterium]MBT2486835.1 glycoside hydrolase family 3 protein [Microbacterium sp. ISL-108]RKN64757.1 glycoside hydrolase family 3 protein [Microbacterium sp. CGR2]